MTILQAEKVLLNSNFQVKKDGQIIHFATLEKTKYSNADILKAIRRLNRQGGYTFIRAIQENDDIIF